jgi:hypothetical protein
MIEKIAKISGIITVVLSALFGLLTWLYGIVEAKIKAETTIQVQEQYNSKYEKILTDNIRYRLLCPELDGAK